MRESHSISLIKNIHNSSFISHKFHKTSHSSYVLIPLLSLTHSRKKIKRRTLKVLAAAIYDWT
jgi:hypothetical protein